MGATASSLDMETFKQARAEYDAMQTSIDSVADLSPEQKEEKLFTDFRVWYEAKMANEKSEEPPVKEELKPEEPKSEEPKSEEPKPEEPKAEEPKPEEPKPEEPQP